MTIRPFIIVAFGLVVGCEKHSEFEQQLVDESKQFKIELLATLGEAERIEVVEHSWPHDFDLSVGQSIQDLPHLEYKRVVLEDIQSAKLIDAIDAMSDAPQTIFTFCLFEAHHSLEIYGPRGIKNTAYVCFRCGDTEWNSESRGVPREFQSVFRRFIEPLGFRAERDWRALTEQDAQQGVPAKSDRSGG